jgi:hypothetical protein
MFRNAETPLDVVGRASRWTGVRLRGFGYPEYMHSYLEIALRLSFVCR